MGARQLQLRHSVRTYIGIFPEPAFTVLATPAPLYAELLRRLSPLGANLGGLTADFNGLESAHVTCQLQNATVRVKLESFEVVFSSAAAPVDYESTIDAVWGAIRATDSTIRISRHEFILGLWGGVEGGYTSMIGTLVRPLETASSASSTPTRGAWNVALTGGASISLSLDEAVDIQDELFARLKANYPGDLSIGAAIAGFTNDAKTVLESAGLVVPELESI